MPQLTPIIDSQPTMPQLTPTIESQPVKESAQGPSEILAREPTLVASCAPQFVFKLAFCYDELSQSYGIRQN
jgi:hypothetical protein